MLESMINAPRPTRAEASDVANAVLDGTDCVMLSGETANGAYPLNAVTIMAKCAIEAEQTLNYRRVYNDIKALTPTEGFSAAEAVASAAVSCVLDLKLSLILVLTENGNIARLVAKYRPPVMILACSTDAHVYRQFSTNRGVKCFKIPTQQGVENVISSVIEEAKKRNYIKEGDSIAVLHSVSEDHIDESNVFKVV